MGHWQETTFRQWLRGQSLYIALDNLPLHTASAIIRGEMIRSLQALAWLYPLDDDAALAERAIVLALRVAVTPEQCGTLWLERGCLAVMQPGQAPCGHPTATDRFDDLAAGLRRAQAQVANTPLATPLFGVAALQQGNEKSRHGGVFHPARHPGMPVCSGPGNSPMALGPNRPRPSRRRLVDSSCDRPHVAPLAIAEPTWV